MKLAILMEMRTDQNTLKFLCLNYSRQSRNFFSGSCVASMLSMNIVDMQSYAYTNQEEGNCANMPIGGFSLNILVLVFQYQYFKL